MVLFQLPYKNITLRGPISPELAKSTNLRVIMLVKLSPDEFFGDADLTGKLRIFPPCGDIKVTGDLFGGISRMQPVEGSRLQKFQYAGRMSECIFTMDGSTAHLEFQIDKLDHLGNISQAIIEFLPASFAAPTTCAVSIISIGGTVDGVPFDVCFEGKAPGGESFSVNEINPKVADYLDVVIPVMFELPRKIIAAHRYLAQSFRLEAASNFSYEFRGERILNLCKALEALMPNHIVADVDGIREYLGGWGLKREQIEVFASIKYLRSELDSAHISISPVTEKVHEAVASFVNVAEKAIQALIITAVKKWKIDKSLYAKSAVLTAEPAVIRHLQKHNNLEIPHDLA